MDKALIQKIMEIRRASNSSCEEAAEKIIAAVRAHDGLPAEWAGTTAGGEPEGEKLWIGFLIDCGKFVGTTNAYRDKSQVENEIACSSRFIGLAPVYLPRPKAGKEKLVQDAVMVLNDYLPDGPRTVVRDVIERLLAEVKGVKS